MSTNPTPLVQRFSQLASIPRVTLVQAPTAVEPLPQLGRRIGYPDLWIKRDDLTGELYGGNKPRKLEYALADVLCTGHTSVVTVGGIGTNHGLATAIYARQLGLGCHLVLVEQPLTEHVRENLRLFHWFGASLHYASSYPGVGWQAARLLARNLLKLNGNRQRVALIGPGGSSALTDLGFVNAAFELKEQVDKKQIEPPAYIFCPSGSGGTLAGLILGARLCGLTAEVIGVRVADTMFAGPGRVANLVNRTLSLIKRYKADVDMRPVDSGDLTILDGYLGEGYGSVTAAGRRAVKLAAEHGIRLETTYSGKAFAALMDFVKTLPEKTGPVLFWNTFNSRDLSAQARSVDFRDLPPAFHRFFDEVR